ncbi:VrrA/YqfQ family protein [Alkalicoccobacillus porphyridii]|uniref:YqfQ-like protein n=1 Tax=Alkalicoccobacillus porphyridii TaxID=2597270 RepID=A0A553ZZ65_9BACI|nr:VrrA/YqfQ family protein [Alkalicoccobacillus porphyridii]TSB46740.1 hypothetical protein FN960_10370 [Alkalicoccobacillus porphyridii]
MQRLFGPPSGPTPMQPLPRNPFMFGPGPGMTPPTFFGPGPQTVTNFMQGTGGRVGLLSRLFGGGAGAGTAFSGAGVANATAGGGFLSGINFSSLLQNAQRIMGITQQVVPMVQQYGPIIRNAPAIWRIMRSQPEPDTTPDNVEVNTLVSQPVPITQASPTITPIDSNQSATTVTTPPTSTVGGMPAPKLYV